MSCLHMGNRLQKEKGSIRTSGERRHLTGRERKLTVEFPVSLCGSPRAILPSRHSPFTEGPGSAQFWVALKRTKTFGAAVPVTVAVTSTSCGVPGAITTGVAKVTVVPAAGTPDACQFTRSVDHW